MATGSAPLNDPDLSVLKAWDLQSGDEWTYSLARVTDSSWYGCESLVFAPDGSLLIGGAGGVRRLVLPDSPDGTISGETIFAADRTRAALSRDGRKLLIMATRVPQSNSFEELVLLDLGTRAFRRITTHGQRLFSAAFDPAGKIIVTSDHDGVVRVGPVTGEEPHLLLGHAVPVENVAVSADGRWIASAGLSEIYLWPMPDVGKPPFHTLAHADLMGRLDALTNLRVVPDPSASTGWKLDVGPFQGWNDVPTW